MTASCRRHLLYRREKGVVVTLGERGEGQVQERQLEQVQPLITGHLSWQLIP